MYKYEYKTDPLSHQDKEFLVTRDLEAHGRLWEQGTGKTKTTIDEAAYNYEMNKIDGLFIVAPDGVHRNWVVEEIPKHLPDRIPVRSHFFSGDRHKSKEHIRAMEYLMTQDRSKFTVLAMSIDQIMTEHGRKAAKDFLTSRRCMYVVDESRRIKEPSAKRTKRVLNSAPYGKMRRILNGTPVANGPFDIYSQIKFLDENFWIKQGIDGFEGFKTMFGTFKQITVAGGKKIEVVAGYKNLDILKGMLAQISSRVTKADVLDLPPKIFKTISFDLSPAQRRVYDQIRDEYLAIMDSGEVVTTPLAITRSIRLQQITCGYLTTETGQDPKDIGLHNPRLDLLKTICEDSPTKIIIWARFKRDIQKICDMLGKDAVRYDGSTDADGRALAIERFQTEGGDAKFFVANAMAAGEGLTLHRGKTAIYYSNGHSLPDRLQSEDRIHRIGQDDPVLIIDFAASNTVDYKIANAMANKLDISSQITGDSARSWFA